MAATTATTMATANGGFYNTSLFEAIAPIVRAFNRVVLSHRYDTITIIIIIIIANYSSHKFGPFQPTGPVVPFTQMVLSIHTQKKKYAHTICSMFALTIQPIQSNDMDEATRPQWHILNSFTNSLCQLGPHSSYLKHTNMVQIVSVMVLGNKHTHLAVATLSPAIKSFKDFLLRAARRGCFVVAARSTKAPPPLPPTPSSSSKLHSLPSECVDLSAHTTKKKRKEKLA